MLSIKKQRGSEKLKQILTTDPRERTMEMIQIVLALLRWNASFQDYPYHTQILLAKCMLHQRYETRRIIVREGHPPFGFYIILSGTVLINVRETDPRTGKTFVRTVHEMSGGDAFGEIALIQNEPRTAAVICKTEVEVLMIMKDDFDVIIKKPLEMQREQHINYCRQHDLFKHFPCDKFKDNVNQFFYQYFKKDTVVVKNSKQSPFIVIVKSGKCFVVSDFVESRQEKKRTRRLEDKALEQIFPLIVEQKRRDELPSDNMTTLGDETDELREVMKANLSGGFLDPLEMHKNRRHSRRQSGMGRRSSTLSNIFDIFEREKKNQVTDSPSATYWGRRLSHIRPMKTPVVSAHNEVEDRLKEMSARRRSSRRRSTLFKSPALEKKEEIVDIKGFAQIAELISGSVFGLETILQQKTSINLALVSDGAECILISKKLFLKEANSKVLRVVSDLVQSYPSQDYVRQQVQQQRSWLTYKGQVVSEVLER
ncbi:uncharacterized protein LOC106178505 isoform X2 [Lingula anatina]|uniref:Uncharacterized protein LOC106178505 isoform X2 n=1 Tax=Lingula anatina TaxID=7574 RepID=A0A1S3K3H1_LINAN|nr:uncharacterized protein LOC106178505 isoform X2 [Lingula anatina]|eukprot:XP_013417170.1 uncharacterized protein LOC106178505 isoform X2 [Lingula anatina]